MKNKKLLLLLPLLALFTSCGGSSESTGTTNPPSDTDKPTDTVKPSEPEKTDKEKISDILSKIDNNYTINYKTYTGRYNIYRTQNYMYDEEIKGGQMVLSDDTMYVYTIENDVVVPYTPNVGTRATFDAKYPVFGVDLTTFVQEGDSFFTTTEDCLVALSRLVNSQPFEKVELFMEDELLNFRFYNKNKVALTAKLFNLNSTHVDCLDNYIKNVTYPEKINNENKELFEVLSGLENNFIFEGKNLGNNKSMSMLMTEDYVMNFSGTATNVQNGTGYVELQDGVHFFTLKDGVATVDFDLYANSGFIVENYPLKRHDYSKFEKIDTNTYLSTDYYNIMNFSDLLIYDGSKVNSIKFVVDTTKKTATISLLNGMNEAVVEGTFSSINSAKVDSLEEYVEGTKVPTLPSYDNTALIEATKDLTNNFTYVNTYVSESLVEPTDEFFGITSDANGRKEYKESHVNYPSTDFISYDDYAFRYNVSKNAAEAKPYDYITAADYKSRFSFESIDFHHFIPQGENTWITTSLKYIGILSNLLGSNPYAKYHNKAIITLKDGTLYFEIDSQSSANTKGYLKDINSTTVPLVDNFKSSQAKPSIPNYENADLKEINDKLKQTNFTVAYQDEPENDIHFTKEDYDYWTKDTFYNGYSNGGLITSPSSQYVYEYGYLEDTDNEDPNNLVVVSHPNLYIDSVSSFNPFSRLDDNLISTFMPFGENELISYNLDAISIFVDALGLGNSSLLGYSASIVRVEEDKLHVSVVDTIDVTYDEDGTRNESYSRFATAIIQDIGTTEIPSFAVIPTIK